MLQENQNKGESKVNVILQIIKKVNVIKSKTRREVYEIISLLNIHVTKTKKIKVAFSPTLMCLATIRLGQRASQLIGVQLDSILF